MHTLKINSYTHRVVTLGILAYRDFLKYLITIQEFTICLNISIIHLKEKLKLIQAGYWFSLRFYGHFTCLSSKIQNAIKLENISNLITSPSSYQCRKTRLVHFVIHRRHASMECILPWTRGGFVTFSTNLSTVPWCPLQQNDILLNIASITQSSNTMHIPYWSVLIDNSFYCSTNHFIV